jgi:hypothetical protein
MHDQGNGPPAPAPGTPEHRTQRALLLELVACPPPAPESFEALAAALREPVDAIRAAARALASAGLVCCAAGSVHAARCAVYFDALWPAGEATRR